MQQKLPCGGKRSARLSTSVLKKEDTMTFPQKVQQPYDVCTPPTQIIARCLSIETNAACRFQARPQLWHACDGAGSGS